MSRNGAAPGQCIPSLLARGFVCLVSAQRRHFDATRQIANLLAERLVSLYRPKNGSRPALATQPVFATSPHWQDLLLFYEYFRAETGQGVGAAHQTGWTGLLANLVMRRYRRDIPEF
jgi:hypothetical protein